jgi:hypothetical protein
VSSAESRGGAGISARQAVERLDEDASRALRLNTEKSSDSHLKTNLMPEDRLLGETARVAAMDTPTLVAADRTECVCVRRRDPESQDSVIEVGADQATADGSAQKLGEKQGLPSKRWEERFCVKRG